MSPGKRILAACFWVSELAITSTEGLAASTGSDRVWLLVGLRSLCPGCVYALIRQDEERWSCSNPFKSGEGRPVPCLTFPARGERRGPVFMPRHDNGLEIRRFYLGMNPKGVLWYDALAAQSAALLKWRRSISDHKVRRGEDHVTCHCDLCAGRNRYGFG